MKPSHITTPRCLSDASFTVGYTSMFTLSEDLSPQEHRSYARWVVLAVIALCLLPFLIKF